MIEILQAEKIVTALPEWKREYLYHIHADILSHHLDAMINSPESGLVAKTDFESPRAKAFHAGWDHAIQRAKDAVTQATGVL